MFDARKDIIGFFEKGIFPYKDNVFKTKEKKSKDEESEKERAKKFIKYNEKESKDLNYGLFKNCFT